ncbi:hypothetical protein B2G63_04680 [Pseudomonas aeruginosa]|nr:hypothetical protein B2G63_04680 [Pseudomonas aeruginosa]
MHQQDAPISRRGQTACSAAGQHGQGSVLQCAELAFALWFRKADLHGRQAIEHLSPEEREVLGHVKQRN